MPSSLLVCALSALSLSVATVNAGLPRHSHAHPKRSTDHASFVKRDEVSTPASQIWDMMKKHDGDTEFWLDVLTLPGKTIPVDDGEGIKPVSFVDHNAEHEGTTSLPSTKSTESTGEEGEHGETGTGAGSGTGSGSGTNTGAGAGAGGGSGTLDLHVGIHANVTIRERIQAKLAHTPTTEQPEEPATTTTPESEEPPVKLAPPPPASTTEASAPVAHSSKRVGLAWDMQNEASLLQQFDGHIGKYYNWGSHAEKVKNGIQFVPTIQIKDKSIDVAQLPKDKVDLIFGPNELDAGMDAKLAGQLYTDILLPLLDKGQFGQLTSPSIRNNNEGAPWLKTFYEACPGCKDKVLANAHFYAKEVDFIKSQIKALCKTYGKIVITELGFTDWKGPLPAADVYKKQQKMIEWLEQAEQKACVTDYFFLASVSDANLGPANSVLTGPDAGAQLTPLGKLIVSGTQTA